MSSIRPASPANEAVKEVITGETHRADASSQLESNQLKIDVAGGNKQTTSTCCSSWPRSGTR